MNLAMSSADAEAAPTGANPYMNAYRREIDHFLRAARGVGTAPVPDDQVHLMEVVEAAYRSARERVEVAP